jgi:para-aminobenzoate synthetase/4-amino-4-deoxychorismate lyase
MPLAWWGIFEGPEQSFDADPWASSEPDMPPSLDWRPRLSREAYGQAFARIRQAIAAGDTYQVNFTFLLEALFAGPTWPFFRNLCSAAPYGAYLDTGRFVICSASPELFFELENGSLRTRPMKGTAPRGRSAEEDVAQAAALAASSKDRAENVMIVDMMRNDLGRVARPGSVRVEELFTVETYPTVHQLTSTVVAETSATFGEVLRALFPCASITGAPKVSTSKIIRQLERGPRGVYTGAVALLSPRSARLSVAIRTATIDREKGIAHYGTGGGIVWDSEVADEYEECRTKTQILRSAPPSFALLETFLWRPESGYFLLERHVDRLLASARYFGYSVDPEAMRAALDEIVPSFEEMRQRVRCTAFRDGRLQVTHEPWPSSGRTRWRIVLDDCPIDTTDPFLFHKTTLRKVYDEALERHGAADEVVLFNERGELTEACRANLVLKIGGEWLTPALHCGLLAGTYRAELLHRGRIREAVLPVEMFEKAERIFLVNSLRGWIRVERLEWTAKVTTSLPAVRGACASQAIKA